MPSISLLASLFTYLLLGNVYGCNSVVATSVISRFISVIGRLRLNHCIYGLILIILFFTSLPLQNKIVTSRSQSSLFFKVVREGGANTGPRSG